MDPAAERLALGLAELERRDLRRARRVVESPQGPRVRVNGRVLVNFSSNDYLGLASDPRLADAARSAIEEYGVGAGASALVSGHLRIHERAEERFAWFCGLPRALLFGSGYLANLGILAALADRDAHIFSDSLNHACLIDGARLSRAQVTVYPHADVGALAEGLAASKAPVRIVATDAVFSMDGDIAPVPQLLELCERHDAWLVIDDAHGVGVLGARGRGTLEHFGVRSPRIVYMATLGKALGGYGAFVAGEARVVEWLVQRARTYIYSTALPPMAAAVAMRALELLDEDPSLLANLHRRIGELRSALVRGGFRGTHTQTAIQPAILGPAARAVEVSARLAERGMLVPAIRPPTVPEGTSRLRISLCGAHRPEEIEALAQALHEHLAA
ncbi:MAG TPA: 8-amino-7-oxononanoate synthase [Usitatibacter sp.]|nr:8-amino-7-oxononanoate synthase [Usitatibacter sp.]